MTPFLLFEVVWNACRIRHFLHSIITSNNNINIEDDINSNETNTFNTVYDNIDNEYTNDNLNQDNNKKFVSPRAYD